jgi:hypothetical protein
MGKIENSPYPGSSLLYAQPQRYVQTVDTLNCQGHAVVYLTAQYPARQQAQIHVIEKQRVIHFDRLQRFNSVHALLCL